MKNKYFIPDPETGEPIEVDKKIFEAYDFIMKELEEHENEISNENKDENE